MANALFTIEQIELIRRLRNSGITKEQVAVAFDQMDNLDAELSKPPNSVCSNVPHYSTVCSPLQTPDRIDRDPTFSPSVHGKVVNGFSDTEKTDILSPLQPFYKHQGDSRYYSWHHSSSNSSGDEITMGSNSTHSGYASPPSNATSSVTSPISQLPSELGMPLSSPSSTSVPVSYSVTNSGTIQSTTYHNSISGGGSSCVPIQCLVNPLDLLQEECYQLEDLKQYSWDV